MAARSPTATGPTRPRDADPNGGISMSTTTSTIEIAGLDGGRVA